MVENKYFKFEGPWSDAKAELLCMDTGSWRTVRPIVDIDNCIHCGICALFCPTQCMENKGEYFEPDLAFCKGCGICANECPSKAITMKPEGEFK